MDQLSHAQGPAKIAAMHQTIGRYLRWAATAYKDCEALVSSHQGIRYTYHQLCREVDCAARAFLALGIEPGERIGLWAANCAEWLVTYYAAAKIGAILVNINPAYRVRELEFLLRHAGISVLIAGRGFIDIDYQTILHSLGPEFAAEGELFFSQQFPQLRRIVWLERSQPKNGLSWDGFMSGASQVSKDVVDVRENGIRCDQPASIIYTSGTTGTPKGATLSHQALLTSGVTIGGHLQFNQTDRICLPVPLYHVFGCALGALSAMTHGGALVLPGETFNPQQCLQTIDAERCTCLYGVPTMFIAQLEDPALKHYRLDSLRTGIMAGAPCPPEVMRRVMDRMHMPELTISYGMTEILACLHTGLNDSFEQRVSTVGVPLPNVECKIIDVASGQMVPRGVHGELCVRSYGLMNGYWNDPDVTAAAVDADGWMHTGDLAAMRDDGFFMIVGRLKDMIIRGGENVYPREIEEVLQAYPKIRDAYVIGVQDPEHGEQVCAWIRLRDGQVAAAEEIRRYCREQIAAYKVPRYIRFVQEFPTTVTGKVQKFRMREISRAEYSQVGG